MSEGHVGPTNANKDILCHTFRCFSLVPQNLQQSLTTFFRPLLCPPGPPPRYCVPRHGDRTPRSVHQEDDTPASSAPTMDAADREAREEEEARRARQHRQEKLEVACQARDYERMDKVLGAGADGRSAGGAGGGADLEVGLGGESSQQPTPLQAAAAEVLVEAGADAAGARLSAIRRDHEQLALDLLRSGDDSGADEADLLIDACAKGHDRLVRALLQRGGAGIASSSSFAAMGNTALHAAARSGHASTAAVVIAAGLDVDAFTWRGETPLHLAGESGSAATVEALVAAGAGVGLRHPTLGDGSTPLHAAAGEGHAEACLALLRHGADPLAADNSGSTPLHLAARGGHAEACLALLRHGADVGAADAAGRRPLHGACERPHPGAVRLLLAWGADETAADGDGRAARDRIPTEEEIERGAALCHLDASSPEGRDARDEYVRRASRDRGIALAVVARAPQDRAWRRRGILVLLRARVERRRLEVSAGGAAGAGAAAAAVAGARGRGSNDTRKLARQESGGGEGAAGARGATNRDGADAAARLVDVQEEGIFRHVVAFL